jgi:hypothetical protein
MGGGCRNIAFSSFLHRSNCLPEPNSIVYPLRIKCCHLNVVHAQLTRKLIRPLNTSAFVGTNPNDEPIKFRPDFLVRLTNGKLLILEVKGQDDQQQQTKREFLAEWVRAVNGHGGFGTWAADVSRHPTDVREILVRHDK